MIIAPFAELNTTRNSQLVTMGENGTTVTAKNMAKCWPLIKNVPGDQSKLAQLRREDDMGAIRNASMGGL
jgi:hypothetical protein